MKGKYKILILGLLFISTINQSVGQPSDELNADFPIENIKMHFSQKLLFPGDVLWFSIYCSNNLKPSEEISKLVFVELLNDKNISLIRKKILLNDGRAEGHFELPEDISTGVYYILGYTSWLKNFDEEWYFKDKIAVINPLQPYENSSAKIPASTRQIKTENTDYSIVKNRLVFNKREKVTLIIKQKNGESLSGAFSVSINKKEPRILLAPDLKQEDFTLPNSVITLPDYQGIRASGKLLDSLNKAVVNQELLLSFPGYGTDLSAYKTGKNGEFHFMLKPRQGSEDLVFILPSESMSVKLEDPFLNGLKNEPAASLSINEKSLKFIETKYQHWQLAQKFENIFYSNNIEKEEQIELSRFYSKPNKAIKFNEYILLDSVAEYFHELIPNVRFKSKKGNYYLTIMDREQMQILGENPGVFVDGVLYTNYNEIAQIPVDQIESIDILSEIYCYKDFVFDGIVNFHTKKANFFAVSRQKNMFRVIYPLTNESKIKFTAPIYNEIGLNSNKPDLRYLLYWSPKYNATEKNPISFYTSDVAGQFEIKITGFTSDGTWLELKDEVTVK